MIEEFEIKIKIKNKLLNLSNINNVIAKFLDSMLCNNKEIKENHYKRVFKEYNFSSPILKEGIVELNNIYSIKLRTKSKTIANELKKYIKKEFEDYNAKLVSIKYRAITVNKKNNWYKTITPTLIRRYEGYWGGIEDFKIDDLIVACENNIRKKYKQIYKEELIGSIIEKLIRTNKYPISIEDYNNTYLCDKYKFKLANNVNKTRVINILLTLGFGERNSRGLGYVKYA